MINDNVDFVGRTNNSNLNFSLFNENILEIYGNKKLILEIGKEIKCYTDNYLKIVYGKLDKFKINNSVCTLFIDDTPIDLNKIILIEIL